MQLRSRVRRLQALQQLRVVAVQREIVVLARVLMLVQGLREENLQQRHGTFPSPSQESARTPSAACSAACSRAAGSGSPAPGATRMPRARSGTPLQCQLSAGAHSCLPLLMSRLKRRRGKPAPTCTACPLTFSVRAFSCCTRARLFASCSVLLAVTGRGASSFKLILSPVSSLTSTQTSARSSSST